MAKYFRCAVCRGYQVKNRLLSRAEILVAVPLCDQGIKNRFEMDVSTNLTNGVLKRDARHAC